MPLSNIKTKSMINLGNCVIHKKEVNVIINKITYDSPEFTPDYHRVMCVLDNLFQIDEEDKLQSYIGHTLLRHMALNTIETTMISLNMTMCLNIMSWCNLISKCQIE